MRTLSATAALLLLWLVAIGCAGKQTAAPVESDFSESFPDPSVFLTTEDVDGVGQVLAVANIPETEEHHAALLELLSGTAAIDTDHLLLLTHAVAPGHVPLPSGLTIVIDDRQITRIAAPRGTGPFAETVDILLMEGASRLSDPSLFNAGRLIGRTEGDQTLVSLTDLLLPQLERLSDSELESVLDGFDDSGINDPIISSVSALMFRQTIPGAQEPPTAREQFIRDILFGRGLVEGEREFLVLDRLEANAERMNIVSWRLSQIDDLTPDRLMAYAALFSSDSYREDVFEAGAERLDSLSGDEVSSFLRMFSSDSYRQDVLEVAVPLLRDQVHGATIRALLDEFHSDSYREDVVVLVAADARLSWHELADVTKEFSSNSYRADVIELLGPHASGDLNGATFQRVVETLSSNSYRIDVIEQFAADLRDLPEDERRRIVDLLSSRSYREDARELLGLSG